MRTVPHLARLSVAVVVLVLAAASAPAQWAEIRSKHFLFGYPQGTPAADDLIIRDIYALCNNGETKFADWVAYRLDPGTIHVGSDSARNWRVDPWLDPSETLEKEDYKDASKQLKVDRGHQAPLASFRGTLDWWHTNYLSNITPQKRALNQGPWKMLEDAVRTLVREKWATVWVMTGPLYERQMEPLPEADEPHKVPSGYWKIVATGDPASPGTVRAVAFIFDQNTARDKRFKDFVVRIDEVEQRSGLNFFWKLPTHIETQLESVLGTWPPG